MTAGTPPSATSADAGPDTPADGLVWALLLAPLTTLAVLVAVGRTASLYLVNIWGPLGEDPRGGGLLSLGAALAAGLLALGLLAWAARLSRVVLVVLVAATLLGCWFLAPRQVDLSESWLPQPNARWSCSGWSFRHYPPDTFDGETTTYCVGFEHRIADG